MRHERGNIINRLGTTELDDENVNLETLILSAFNFSLRLRCLKTSLIVVVKDYSSVGN